MRRSPPTLPSSPSESLRVAVLAAVAVLAFSNGPALAEGGSIGGAIGGGSAGGSTGGSTGGGSGGSIGGKITPPAAPPSAAPPAAEKHPEPSQRAERRKPSRRNERAIRDAGRGERGGSNNGGGGGVGQFDGMWTVSTYSSECSNTSRSQERISRGRIVGLAPGGSTTGSVSPSGAVHTVGHYIGQTFIGSGRMSGNSGSGSFRRSDGCRGTWTASR